MEYKLIVENWKKYNKLNEAVYSDSILRFIKGAKEIEQSGVTDENLKEIVKNLHNWADKHLRFLGQGTQRTAYTSKQGEVVKIVNVPYSDQGTLRTATFSMKKEVDVFDRHDIHGMFPKIMEVSENYLWFVTEEMDPLTTMSEKRRMTLMKKWFPKLYEIATKGHKLPATKQRGSGSNLPMSSGLILNIAGIVASYFSGFIGSDSDRVLQDTLNSFAYHARAPGYGGSGEASTISKEYIEDVYNYMKNPDKTVKTMAHILKATNTRWQDYHTGNIAVDDEENMKIIDI